jgi:acyl carrier protein
MPQGDAAAMQPRHCVAADSAQRKGDLSVQRGDFTVNDEQILDIVHQTAAEMMAAKDGEGAGQGSVAGTGGPDSLVDRYGFSSIDTLQCVLILEGKFGITLADEFLSHEVLSSASALAKHIAALRRTQAVSPN